MAEDLVTIATYRYLTEAEAARMHLEGEGIQAFLADAEIVNMDWLIANAVGDIKLQVSPLDADRAGRILARIQRKRRYRELEFEDHDDLTECLACGARFPEEGSACPVCGWTFENTGPE